MQTYSVRVEKVVDASPAKVYAILADYREHHPKILPQPPVESLIVEKGGRGAGTVVRLDLRFMGARNTLVMKVTEPEPGRVLQEEDEALGIVTRFTLTPLDAGTRCKVEISTDWRGRSGFRGLLERVLNPSVAASMYRKELDLLATYAHTMG